MSEERKRRKETANKVTFKTPGKTTGIDGDIIVTNTKNGPTGKIKYNNKWWNFRLEDPAVSSGVIFTPKAWYMRGTTSVASPATDAINQYISLPAQINKRNIIAINFSISIGVNERAYFWLGDSGTAQQYDMYVFYNDANNFIRLQMKATSSGSQVQGKDFTLTVLFK